MKVQLINLGRNNINKIVFLKDNKALNREIDRCVMIPGWTLVKDPRDYNSYHVLHRMDIIGKVKILEL